MDILSLEHKVNYNSKTTRTHFDFDTSIILEQLSTV